MKILFINPPIRNLVQAETPKFVTTERGYSPPLGLIQLATCINQNTRHEATVLDAQVLELNFGDIKREIKKINPAVVGISGFTFTLLDTLCLAKIVKEVNPEIKVIFGGSHPTLFPYETIKQRYVDVVVVGEGEITFQELINSLDNWKKLKDVNGIFFKENGRILKTKPREFVKDLDDLPIPDRTLTPYKKYFSVLSKRNPLTTAVVSRGCSYKCTFCDRPQAGGKSWRARSPNLVVDEMERCGDLGIKEILFYDDTWTMHMKRAKEICKEILSRKLDISWDIRTRVDRVDYDLLKFMKRAGCGRVNFGVESGTIEGLIAVKKEVDLKTVENAFKLCKKADMDSLAYFMFGIPGETKEQMLETIKFAKRIKPDFCHFTVFTPFPETGAWRDLLSKGNTTILESWRKYAETPTTTFDAPTCNEHLNKEQLFDMCNYAYKSFYFRPCYMIKELVKVKSIGEFIRKSKAGINMLGSS